MALSIKNPETERLARELARTTGEGLTEAVTKAPRDRLVRIVLILTSGCSLALRSYPLRVSWGRGAIDVLHS